MTVAELLQGIRDADRHRDGIRCLRLFRVEPGYFVHLRADLDRLGGQAPASDVAQPEHVTHWTRPFGSVRQWSLLNASGRYDDFSTDHDLSCFGKRFHEPEVYPALARLVTAFPHTVNFRINVLGPQAGLAPHEEHALVRTRAGTVGARVRFHLPVVTNPEAELTLDGHVYHLEAGTIYFVNHGCVHSAANQGAAGRMHLVWDMLLTRSAFDCMFAGTASPDAPLQRVTGTECAPVPVRTERVVPAPRRLPPRVSADEADALGLCEAQ
jgi:Aspartyl/Asparaginyl beta-hydroxylase